MDNVWQELAAIAARKRAEAQEAEPDLAKVSFGNSDSGKPSNDGGTSPTETYLDGQRRICEISNRTVKGNLTGCDCPDCLNRGFFFDVDEKGFRFNRECKCMTTRRNAWRIEKSGLSDLMRRYTFDTWETVEPWQESIKRKAKAFAENPDGWLAVCGKSGAGKTHICTAVCGELMKHGYSVLYMLWRDVGTKIKAAIKDQNEYRRLLDPLKTVQVLYIDDLFKTGKGQMPTTADVNLAFEIINSRYNTENLITVVSSEMTLEEIMDADEAIGSRIYERAAKHGNYFNLREKQNWRLTQEVSK